MAGVAATVGGTGAHAEQTASGGDGGNGGHFHPVRSGKRVSDVVNAAAGDSVSDSVGDSCPAIDGEAMVVQFRVAECRAGQEAGKGMRATAVFGEPCRCG